VSRIYRRGNKYGVDFVDNNGARIRKLVSTDKRIAKEILNGYLGRTAMHLHLGVIEDSPITFADFAQIWKQRVAPSLKPRSQEKWFGIIDKHLMPAFSGKLRSITAGAIEDYTSNRTAAGAAPATVNAEVSVLKHMLRRAVKWHFITSNPALEIATLKEPAGRVRYLTVEEISRLLDACDKSPSAPYLRVLATVALNCGARRNELIFLARHDVDWQHRLIRLDAAGTKSGKPRDLYLNSVAFDALRSLPVRLDDRLFPFTAAQASMALIRAARAAGLHDVGLHTLRHTFASHQSMGGVRQPGLMALLGHSDPRMTQKYVHIGESFLRESVDALQLGAATPPEKDAKTAS
jgi:integrase